MVQKLEAWADELGEKFQLTVFGKRVVVVAGNAGVRHVLNMRPRIYRRGLTPTHFHWPAKKMGLLPALFFDEGKEWGRSRRLICPHLVGDNVADMIPSIAKITERFCAQMSEKADAGEVLDAIHAFECFAHDSIALAAFGLHADSIAAPNDQPCPSFDCVKTVIKSFMTLMMQPLAMLGWVTLPWLLPWVKHTNKQSRLLQNMIQGAINNARLKNSKGVRTSSEMDGVDSTPGGVLLLKMASLTEGEKNAKHLPDRMAFSDEEVVRQGMSLFIGGTGTTAFVLCWTMYYLTKYPEMLARCRKEALQAAPERNGVVSTREQVAKLDFCSAVFMETLRTRSSSTVLFFHNAETATMEDGTVLEKDTGIIALTRYAGESEDCFTRAKDFVPERWIEAEREEALLGKGDKAEGNRSVNHDEKGFLAFGAGPRVCPGKAVAKAEGAMIIAAMCARFDMALGPGQADPPDEILTCGSGPRTARLVLTKRVTA